MGYRVMCYPSDEPAGELKCGMVQRGRVTGTYFDHIPLARAAAQRWVNSSGGPNGYAEIRATRNNLVIDTIYRKSAPVYTHADPVAMVGSR